MDEPKGAASVATSAVCHDADSFSACWGALRRLAVAHMRTYNPAHAPLTAFKNLTDNILPTLLSLKVMWRSKAQNMVVMTTFTGVRYAMPSDQRAFTVDRGFDFESHLTHAEWCKEHRRSYCLVVMVNATTTTVMCGTNTDVSKIVDLAPGETKRMSADQEAAIKRAAEVHTNHVIEAPLIKIPIPIGLEAMDDVQQWRPYSHSHGEFIINGRTFKQHAIVMPATNKVMAIEVRQGQRRYVRTIMYALADGSYRSTATISMDTKLDFHVCPNLVVNLPYPREREVSLYETFLLLHVPDVSVALRFMWPCGVPPRERIAAAQARKMLINQRKDAIRRKVHTRDDLFSTLEFDLSAAKDRSGGDTDTFGVLQQYQKMCASTVAEIFPQQGTVHVRDVILRKAVILGYMSKMAVLSSLGVRDLDDRDSPLNQRHQYIDQRLGRIINGAVIKHVIPVLRKNIRQQAVQSGGAVVGGALLLEKHRPVTGMVFRAFTGRGKEGGPGGEKAVQQARYAPTDDANAITHLPLPSKNTAEHVRANKAGHLGVCDLWNTPDGEVLGLDRRRALGVRWRAGVHKRELEAQARLALGESIQPLIPALSKDDEAYIATGRSIDFFVTAEFMHRACMALTSDPSRAAGPCMGPLLLVNGAVVGKLRGITATCAIEKLLRARRCGVLMSEVSIRPHTLGVSLVCDNGGTQRPLIVMANFHKLQALVTSRNLHSSHDLLTAAQRLGVIVYASPEEVQGRALVIAMDPYDLRQRRGKMERTGTPFTHMECHPFILMCGCSFGRIPFSMCGASPRSVFGSMMLSHAAFADGSRSSTQRGTHLVYPQAMLAQTLMSEAYGPMLASANVVIAVVADHMLKDDAWVVNAASAQRGLLSVVRKFTYTSNNCDYWRVVSKHEWNSFHRISLVQQGDRSKLDDRGVIKRGSAVIPNKTVLVQRVCTKSDPTTGTVIIEDASMLHTRSMSTDDVWIVQSVVHGTEANGWRTSVTLSYQCKLEVGDKLATMFGQKATIAELRPAHLMPFVHKGPNRGLVPDIMMNALAYGRMTVGNAVMMDVGVAALQTGVIANGTPFEPFDMDAVFAAARKTGHGLDHRVVMCNGETGMRIGDLGLGAMEPGCTIALGVIPMMRLFKHTPRDKINACGGDARLSSTTGQPLKGRADSGAPMRYGTMPGHAVTVHGASFVNQDAIHRANMTTFYICKSCGMRNAAPPFDFMGMARTTQADTAELQSLLEVAKECTHCGKPDVKATRMPMVVAMIDNVLGAENIEMKFTIEPTAHGELLHAQAEAEEEMRAAVADVADGVAPGHL